MPAQTYHLAQIICQRGAQIALLQPDAALSSWWLVIPQSPEQSPQRVGEARLLPPFCQRAQLQPSILIYVASWAI